MPSQPTRSSKYFVKSQSLSASKKMQSTSTGSGKLLPHKSTSSSSKSWQPRKSSQVGCMIFFLLISQAKQEAEHVLPKAEFQRKVSYCCTVAQFVVNSTNKLSDMDQQVLKKKDMEQQEDAGTQDIQSTRYGLSIRLMCASRQTRRINLEFSMCMVNQIYKVLSVPSNLKRSIDVIYGGE